jgi:dihydroflavonol-4-reductase
VNVLVIGGSGLLGSFTVSEALKRGHGVTVLSRGLMRQNAETGPGVRTIRGDVYAMSRPDFERAFAGQGAIVYALGLDDRQLHDRPAYDVLHGDHVNTCLAVLRAAREAGVRKFVVFGSYFAYFDRLMPDLKLSYYHPYVRTRREQEDAVIDEAGPGFDTFVLEIPYVIGALPGRVPPWSFLFNMLAGKGNLALFFKKGGTAAVTARQIGEAAIGAIERGKGGTAYPMGGINLAWTELARRFFSIVGARKRLLSIPPGLFATFGFLGSILLFFRGKARGLNLARFAAFQYMNAFIAPEPSMAALGYAHDDYDSALSEMVGEWERQATRKR